MPTTPTHTWQALLRLAISGCCLALLTSCSIGGSWQRDETINIVTIGDRGDHVEPDAAWSGQLVTVDGCVGVEMEDSTIFLAVFYSGTHGVISADSADRGVQLDNGDVLPFDTPLEGGGGYLEKPGWDEEYEGSASCAGSLGAEGGIIIISGETVE